MIIEAIMYFWFTCVGLVGLWAIASIIYHTWYGITMMKNDWHRCWDCKKITEEIFFTKTIFGRIYRCSECSKKHKLK